MLQSVLKDPSMWYALIVIFTSAVCLLTMGSVIWVTSPRRRRALPTKHREPISILKPLCGVDDNLEENLETFFHQDYPDYEIIFGISGDTDPAIQVVQRLRKKYPGVRSRLIVHHGQRGLNPKVNNLRAMLEKGHHDVVVISDSNIAVDPDYLEELYGHLLDENVGLVTSIITGVGEESIGATLENLHLNGQISGIKAATEIFGIQFVIGKSVMLRMSTFDQLGGFESVSMVLAEDHLMGLMYQLAGYTVRISSRPVRNVCVTSSVARFFMRHVRWGLIRTRLKPFIYALEPLSNPLAVALMAPLFDVDLVGPMLWAIGLLMARDGVQWARMRGPVGLIEALPLSVLKEALCLVAWVVAPFSSHISWRGQRYLVGMGTHMYAETPMAAPGEVKEMV